MPRRVAARARADAADRRARRGARRAALLVAAVLASSVPGLAVPDARPVASTATSHDVTDDDRATVRTAAPAAAGADRVATGDVVAAAVEVSRTRFDDDGAAHAVLARGDAFPDALAGAALTDRGPLLLTGRERLDPLAADELVRVLPTGGTVHLLGGRDALGAAVEAGLLARGLRPVRHDGDDRVATALEVADAAMALRPGGRVAIARAFPHPSSPTSGWADAISAGAWAAATGTPVLLTPGDRLDPRVAAFLERRRITGTMVLGGREAVGDAVVAALPAPVRVSGSDRAGTAAAVADELMAPTHPDGVRGVVLLDLHAEDGWARGLAAAALVAERDQVLLAAGRSSLPDATAAWLGRCTVEPGALVALGPPTVTSDAALERARAAATCPTGTHAFALTTSSGEPLRYDPCQPITLAVNLAGAPAGATARLDAAVADVAAATGLRFRRTTTDERLASPLEARDSYVDPAGGYAPVLVNWPADWSGTQAIGFAGSAWVNEPRPRYVSGVVSIDPAIDGDLLDHVLLHELAHLVGLSHVDTASQVMFPRAQPRLQAYQAGDREGLRHLGRAAGCMGSASTPGRADEPVAPEPDGLLPPAGRR